MLKELSRKYFRVFSIEIYSRVFVHSRFRVQLNMIILEHLSVWTYLELTFYICMYRKLFSVLTNKFDHSDFRTKWSINRGSAVGIANLIVSALFGLGASLSGSIILYLRLKSVSSSIDNNINNGALGNTLIQLKSFK